MGDIVNAHLLVSENDFYVHGLRLSPTMCDRDTGTY